ncbi:MAG: hypothetical protein EBS01_01135, partial [Verrucomicrobia bacterium]|nr:hypothetical protein [Verrucomicrobiota bacterium]
LCGGAPLSAPQKPLSFSAYPRFPVLSRFGCKAAVAAETTLSFSFENQSKAILKLIIYRKFVLTIKATAGVPYIFYYKN